MYHDAEYLLRNNFYASNQFGVYVHVCVCVRARMCVCVRVGL